mmetsp:Transcript_126680/g.270253  ORF Transcript_126680/g.270253 Transcript_126680/m.270253 type:complete len:450 (+) Transcript_126680:44-1393(+)
MGSCISRSCVSLQNIFRWGSSNEREKHRTRLDLDEAGSADECTVLTKLDEVLEQNNHVEVIALTPSFRIINMDLQVADGPQKASNTRMYYGVCREFKGLHVTTSCFTTWKQSKRTNGSGKMIPAIPTQKGDNIDPDLNVCVFFFDDNLEFEGTEDSPGICNLRDVHTGDFVDFTCDRNGFRKSQSSRHTVIHHSTEFRNVLVKANILDALEDGDYFHNIIRQYAKPDEKILVFMDVNSTIMCNDTSANKDARESLMSLMFELIEVQPRRPFEISWDRFPPLRVDKVRTLKQIVKDMVQNDRDAYSAFWEMDNCCRFFDLIGESADIRWSSDHQRIDAEGFRESFQHYLSTMSENIVHGGITSSWFQLFGALQEGEHAVILNSFGVDTRKVVLATVPDERDVTQITVNYELWDKRDVERYESQYRGTDASSPVGASSGKKKMMPREGASV